MLKKIAICGIMFSFLSLPLLAQQTAVPDAPPANRGKMGRGNRSGQTYQMADAATRAQHETDRLTQQLGLDQATSQKVHDAALAHSQKVDAINATSDDNQTKQAALKANADDFKTKLQGILTPDQFAQLQSMKGRMGRDKAGNGRHRGDRPQN
ncbi:DUF4890 domain-containing protein [Spirosoma sp. SC4-14]|uniref:DUF4890 domain-containing protein n=1 Tax=Spirosoma sp. SC4-14 TaxID=3128900 RepID=UPI0030D40D46